LGGQFLAGARLPNRLDHQRVLPLVLEKTGDNGRVLVARCDRCPGPVLVHHQFTDERLLLGGRTVLAAPSLEVVLCAGMFHTALLLLVLLNPLTPLAAYFNLKPMGKGGVGGMKHPRRPVRRHQPRTRFGTPWGVRPTTSHKSAAVSSF